MGCEGELVTPRVLAENEGVTVADPWVIERSWEMGGFGRDDEEFCFGEVQLEVLLGHPGGDQNQNGIFSP